MRLLGFALLVSVAAGGAACRPTSTDESTVVDTDLMAFLSEARALHHQANLKEDAGDLAGAAAAMERLVAARAPRPSPEVREVLADGYARLAELRLKRGELDAAAKAAERGLEQAPDVTYFRGHLVEVQALVEEARAATLADAGNADAATKARERAIVLLEDVVKIQDQVIARSLEKDAGSGGRSR